MNMLFIETLAALLLLPGNNESFKFIGTMC